MRTSRSVALRSGIAAFAVLALVGAAGAVPAQATSGAAEPGARPWHARLVGEQVIPPGTTVEGAAVGELSGIDYDRRTGRWYLLSDDSEEGPARLFTARLDLDRSHLAVRFTGATLVRRSDGTPFPPFATNDPEVADPESVRLDPGSRTLYWSSEGKREVPTDGTPPALVDPWVRQMTTSGRHLRQLQQPRNLRMSATEQGPRRNAVFEGLTLTTDGRQLVTSTEGPRYEDGPLPTTTSGAVNRLTWYDKRTGRPGQQLAYPLDPIPATPVPPTAGADNGISELLAIDRHRYLVLERAFVSGVGNSIRLYEIDVRGATDVRDDRSLSEGHYRPVGKRLVLDFATLGLDHVDNVEGMSWGPRLRGGERTLVFVSDDNFNPSQVTQLIAVAIR